MNAVKIWIKKHPLLVTLLILTAVVLIVRVAWPQHKESDPYQMYRYQAPWPVGWRILCLSLSMLLGFAIGAFFSPLLHAFRKMIFIGVAVIVLLFATFGPYPLADSVNGVASIILFFIAFAFGINLGVKALKAVRRKRPTSFGSAKWATYEYLMEAALFKGKGYLLGNLDDPAHAEALHYEGQRHLLTVAPCQ